MSGPRTLSVDDLLRLTFEWKEARSESGKKDKIHRILPKNIYTPTWVEILYDIGEIYFDQVLSDEVDTTTVYKLNVQPTSTNEDGMFFKEMEVGGALTEDSVRSSSLRLAATRSFPWYLIASELSLLSVCELSAFEAIARTSIPSLAVVEAEH